MKNIIWKIIYTAAGMAEARIITGRLEAEDIPVKLEYEAIGAIYGLTIDGLGEVRILVPERYEHDAKEALAVIYDENEIVWDKEP
ncbi:MAG: DUF2007 domain-containing protein [Syntrophales bacterium]|nr:DUF2007 domain-containing protein [Syntrophales bacterium]